LKQEFNVLSGYMKQPTVAMFTFALLAFHCQLCAFSLTCF